MCKSLLGFDGEKKWASTLQTTRERNSIGVHIYMHNLWAYKPWSRTLGKKNSCPQSDPK